MGSDKQGKISLLCFQPGNKCIMQMHQGEACPGPSYWGANGSLPMEALVRLRDFPSFSGFHAARGGKLGPLQSSSCCLGSKSYYLIILRFSGR